MVEYDNRFKKLRNYLNSCKRRANSCSVVKVGETRAASIPIYIKWFPYGEPTIKSSSQHEHSHEVLGKMLCYALHTHALL